MTRGRKPTAPHLKVIAGTDRPDRGAPDDAPEFDLIEEFPEAPDTLRVEGVKMWNELGPKLVAAKVLQVVDLYALQQLCYQWQCMCAKQRAGLEINAAENTAFKGLLSEFGMTPASRRKVSSGGDTKKPGNKFGALGAPGK